MILLDFDYTTCFLLLQNLQLLLFSCTLSAILIYPYHSQTLITMLKHCWLQIPYSSGKIKNNSANQLNKQDFDAKIVLFYQLTDYLATAPENVNRKFANSSALDCFRNIIQRICCMQKYLHKINVRWNFQGNIW